MLPSDILFSGRDHDVPGSSLTDAEIRTLTLEPCPELSWDTALYLHSK